MDRPAWMGGHGRWQRQLQGFADGSLRGPGRERFSAHLAACARCAAELDELQAVRAFLRALPDSPAPRSFAITDEMAARPAPGPAANMHPDSVPTPVRPPAPVAALRFARVTAAVAALGFGLVLAADLGGAWDRETGSTQLTAREAVDTRASSAGQDTPPGSAAGLTPPVRDSQPAIESSSQAPASLPTYDSGGPSGQSVPLPAGTAAPQPPGTGRSGEESPPVLPGDQQVPGEKVGTGQDIPLQSPAEVLAEDEGSRSLLRGIEVVLGITALAAAAIAMFASRALRRAR